MTPREFKLARKERRWTQHQLAVRLGVSQCYVALLERGKRNFPVKLASKAVTLLGMSPLALPVGERHQPFSPEHLAQQLGSLGYPGFAYLRGTARKRNPVEVLVAALEQNDLEPRLTEALPWLVLQYGDMGDRKQWLVEQARLRNLTNRLGFVVSLAKEICERIGDRTSSRYQALVALEEELRLSRLDQEDTLCQSSLSQQQRDWLRQTRPHEAAYWHLLTDWRPEHLQYAR